MNLDCRRVVETTLENSKKHLMGRYVFTSQYYHRDAPAVETFFSYLKGMEDDKLGGARSFFSRSPASLEDAFFLCARQEQLKEFDENQARLTAQIISFSNELPQQISFGELGRIPEIHKWFRFYPEGSARAIETYTDLSVTSYFNHNMGLHNAHLKKSFVAWTASLPNRHENSFFKNWWGFRLPEIAAEKIATQAHIYDLPSLGNALGHALENEPLYSGFVRERPAIYTNILRVLSTDKQWDLISAILDNRSMKAKEKIQAVPISPKDITVPSGLAEVLAEASRRPQRGDRREAGGPAGWGKQKPDLWKPENK